MSGGDKFQSAKAAQGYVSALNRPRCDTCKHSVDCYGSAQQCRIGGFFVSKFGHCERWEQRPRGTFHPRS